MRRPALPGQVGDKTSVLLTLASAVCQLRLESRFSFSAVQLLAGVLWL